MSTSNDLIKRLQYHLCHWSFLHHICVRQHRDVIHFSTTATLSHRTKRRERITDNVQKIIVATEVVIFSI